MSETTTSPGRGPATTDKPESAAEAVERFYGSMEYIGSGSFQDGCWFPHCEGTMTAFWSGLKESYVFACDECKRGGEMADVYRALNEEFVRRMWHGDETENGRAAGENGHKPPPDAPDGVELLDRLVKFLRRFVVLTEAQADVIALWVLHTWAFVVADATPYIQVTSAEKESGKTRLLEILEVLVARAWFAGRVTAAVLARKTEDEQPTLLLDESDAAFRGDREYAEALRGILNAGYRRGGKVTVCVGQGANIGYRDFSVFSPKAIAGLNRLPDTIASRSIRIEMKRRKPSEQVERFRFRRVRPQVEKLRADCEAWAEANTSALAEAEPDLPEALGDRAQDVCEPLLAIADRAGGEWPKRARTAVVALLTGSQWEDSESLGVRLLRDVRDAFDEKGTDRLRTTDLLTILNRRDDAPWGSLRGEALDARGLARLLKPYGVTPDKWREGDDTRRGYVRADFLDSWARYLPDPDLPDADDDPDDRDPPTPGKGATSATSATHAMHSRDNPHTYAENSGADTVADTPPVADKRHTSATENSAYLSQKPESVADVADNLGTGGEASRPEDDVITSTAEVFDAARTFFDLDTAEESEHG